jgi:hypothetical protein
MRVGRMVALCLENELERTGGTNVGSSESENRRLERSWVEERVGTVLLPPSSDLFMAGSSGSLLSSRRAYRRSLVRLRVPLWRTQQASVVLRPWLMHVAPNEKRASSQRLTEIEQLPAGGHGRGEIRR